MDADDADRNQGAAEAGSDFVDDDDRADQGQDDDADDGDDAVKTNDPAPLRTQPTKVSSRAQPSAKKARSDRAPSERGLVRCVVARCPKMVKPSVMLCKQHDPEQVKRTVARCCADGCVNKVNPRKRFCPSCRKCDVASNDVCKFDGCSVHVSEQGYAFCKRHQAQNKVKRVCTAKACNVWINGVWSHCSAHRKAEDNEDIPTCLLGCSDDADSPDYTAGVTCRNRTVNNERFCASHAPVEATFPLVDRNQDPLWVEFTESNQGFSRRICRVKDLTDAEVSSAIDRVLCDASLAAQRAGRPHEAWPEFVSERYQHLLTEASKRTPKKTKAEVIASAQQLADAVRAKLPSGKKVGILVATAATVSLLAAAKSDVISSAMGVKDATCLILQQLQASGVIAQ